jgi:ketosteroid isomerase-like protein
MDGVAIVKQVYERFARGDAPGVLALFRDDVEFRLAEGHPYQPSGEAWIGHDAIVRNFFARAGGEWEGWTITPSAFLEPPGAVVVECRYTGVFTPTGKRMDVQVCHVWRIVDGKVASFHQYLDSAALQAIMRR